MFSIPRITPYIIFLSAILLTLETVFHQNNELLFVFNIVDYFIIFFFTVEIIYRFLKFEYNKNELVFSLKSLILTLFKGQNLKNNRKECLNELLWFLIDLTILILSIVSLFFISIFKHPEILSMFRVIRIFRIVRIFEINKTLREIEKKIVSVVPTIFIFGTILFLIIFIFALIGSNIYNFKKYETIDFTSIYEAMISLFICLTNGWSDVHTELKQTSINRIITDFYMISFFVSCSMLTLNLFLSVMISQIQDKLIKKVDKNNLKEIQKTEDLNESIQVLIEKINLLEGKMKDKH